MQLFKKEKPFYLFSLALFILSALYGLLIRWNFVFPIQSFTYKNFLQSHSHVAFLGWGYIATIGAIIHCFVPNTTKKKQVYKITLLLIFVTVALMLLSFPLGGYKLFSIVLLCLFGVTSYVLSFKLLKDIKGGSISTKLIKYGIYYYLLSSLATWFLAYVLVSQGKTELYYNTVYFYLHFLYNGYFVFVLFGLLFKIIENQQVLIPKKLQNNFFIFLNIACIPAYALSILWSKVSFTFNIIGFLAAVLQLISLVYLFRILKNVYHKLEWKPISKILLKFGVIAYSLKIVIQILSSFPYFVDKSLALKPFLIIGYLHLFTLGFMSVFVFLTLIKLHKIHIETASSKIGLFVFLIGIIGTELLLFTQGFLVLIRLNPIPNYNLWLFIVSVLLFVGLLLIFVNQLKKRVL